ncbi:MAG: hypothetical protein M5U34_25620 [Chloroflexi bacterium]|nr:hypothetical protein [Chloroflexota bacterium]
MNLNETPQRIRIVIIVVLVGTAVLPSVLDATGNLNAAFAFIRDPFTTVLAWTSGRAETVSGALAGPVIYKPPVTESPCCERRWRSWSAKTKNCAKLQANIK